MAANGLALTTLERFMTKVEITSTCWNWLGHLDENGYGTCGRVPGSKSTPERAYRRAYRLIVGQVPEGSHLHHVCRNRRCVNPSHLSPMKPGAHSQHHATKATACTRGHPYPDSARIRADGTQVCRVCDAERKRRSRQNAGVVRSRSVPS